MSVCYCWAWPTFQSTLCLKKFFANNLQCLRVPFKLNWFIAGHHSFDAISTKLIKCCIRLEEWWNTFHTISFCNLIQPTRIFEWRKHRIRFYRDSHKISQQWTQKYFDKYTNSVLQWRKIRYNKSTNTFRFGLILLFWRSIGLWGGEQVIVEPGGAAGGDGVGHGGRAHDGAHHGKNPSICFTWFHPTRDCQFQTRHMSSHPVLCERFDATEAQFRDIQNRCKSALLQPPLRQVFKT